MRVCDLRNGTDGLVADDDSIEVVYRRHIGPSEEELDFSAVPHFDLLTASLPPGRGAGRGTDAQAFVLRFLRFGRPAAFAISSRLAVGARFRRGAEAIGYELREEGKGDRIMTFGVIMGAAEDLTEGLGW